MKRKTSAHPLNGSCASKKQTLLDYFAPLTNTLKPDCFTTEKSSPISGLSVIKDFLSPSQEAQILQFLDTQHWRTDLARRVIHYGGSYCLLGSSDIIQAPPIPEELNWLVKLLLPFIS